MKKGYPLIILKKEDRKKYYKVLNQADNGDLTPLTNFIAKAVNEYLQYYLSFFIEDQHLIPLSELAKHTSYSQEYLSLRARQIKLDAVKIDNIWYSSKKALNDYIKNTKKVPCAVLEAQKMLEQEARVTGIRELSRILRFP